MKCQEIEILLSAYVDEEVTPQEKQAVENHVKECSNCRAMMTSFETLHNVYQKMEIQEAPSGFRQRVTQRIDAKPRVVFPWRLPRLAYLLLFSLLVLLSGIIIAVHVMQEPQQQQASLDIDVYAEDILFDQGIFSSTEMFSVGEISIAEEILDTIDFTNADTSLFFGDDSSSRTHASHIVGGIWDVSVV